MSPVTLFPSILCKYWLPQLAVEIGVADVKPMHMPVLKCSHGYDEAHSFEVDNKRKNLVVVHSLNLGEAFRHKVGSLSTIVFNVKYPTILDDLSSFGVLYQVKNVPSVQSIKFLLTSSLPFIKTLFW